MPPDEANHAIRDGDLRIVYIAGKRGVYKLFPDSGEIFLMKGIEADEIAHMVGYGALSRRVVPVLVAVELILTPKVKTGYSALDANYAFRHYKPGVGWTLRRGPVDTATWAGVRASKFSPDKWAIWGSGGNPLTQVPLYVSSDAGVTWQHVDLPKLGNAANIEIANVMWSPATDDVLFVAASPYKGNADQSAAVFYGNPFTAMNGYHAVPQFARNGRWQASGALEDGRFYGRTYQGGGVSAHPKYRILMEPNGALVFKTLSDLEIENKNTVTQVGSAIIMSNVSKTYRTLNYLASDVSYLMDLPGGNQMVSTADHKVFIGDGDGVREMQTPLDAPTIVTATGGGHTTQAIGVDSQTRSTVVAMQFYGPNYSPAFYVYSGATWEEFDQSEAFDGQWINRNTIEVIVRGA